MFSGILPVSLPLCKVSVRFPTEQDTQDESPKGRTRQHIRDRLVYNDWDLYSFVQMLTIRVSALWESTLYNRRTGINTFHMFRKAAKVAVRNPIALRQGLVPRRWLRCVSVGQVSPGWRMHYADQLTRKGKC
jgi:hypothetical protein